jgi:hypothetical protein
MTKSKDDKGSKTSSDDLCAPPTEGKKAELIRFNTLEKHCLNLMREGISHGEAMRDMRQAGFDRTKARAAWAFSRKVFNATVPAIARHLARGWSGAVICEAMLYEYGLPRPYTKQLMSSAREWMREALTGLSKQDLKAESIQLYREITGDLTAKPAERIKARERIDKLLGLEEVEDDDEEAKGDGIILTPAQRKARIMHLVEEARRITDQKDVIDGEFTEPENGNGTH